jgi:hypothetical protein
MTDLSRITQGVGYYVTTGSFGTTGSMVSSISIDFGNKIIGGGPSFVYVAESAFVDVTSSMPPINFSDVSGNAAFHWSNVPGVLGGNFSAIDVTLKNSGGVIANEATIKTNYTGSFSGTGSATGPRVSAEGTQPEVIAA